MSEAVHEQKDNKKEQYIISEDVIGLYDKLENLGIKIWIDGGWSVDALLGRQLRPHKDLDIAIQWKDVPRLCEILAAQGYEYIREDSQWNFVLTDKKGHEIDVHAFVYDDKGNIVEGIMYPKESLTGTGTIIGYTVRCISPKYMVEFLTQWVHKWPDKYLEAISELCKKYDMELPKECREFKKNNG